jgi:MinD-like ATPase involved in chromosome partitioning or flagellar assembly
LSNKLITVWGAPGSGKTTVAVNLAAALAKEDTVLLISSNLWFPEIQLHYGQVVKEENSLARLTREGFELYELFTPVKGMTNLQLLTLPDDYVNLFGDYMNKQLADSLFQQLDRYRFASIVVDGSAMPDNALSTIALSHATTILHVCRPNVSGLFWRRAMQHLRDALSLDKKTLYIANCPDNSLLYGEIEPDYELPYVEQMEQYLSQNKTAFAANQRKYAARIKDIAAAVQREVRL